MPGFNENKIRPIDDYELHSESNSGANVSCEPTDFISLTKSLSKKTSVNIPWTLTDYLLGILNPLLILIMVWSIVFFLLDVRYVYTEVNDPYLRLVAFSFILGVVALNRLFAREGIENGIMYGTGLAIAIGLYTIVSTTMYGMGSVVRNFMNTSPGLATLFNMGVVIFLWWLTNRITYECCIEENPQSGEIGLLTGINKAIANDHQKSKKKRKNIRSEYIFYEFEPIDPTELGIEERNSVKKLALGTMGFSQRLSSIPAGISVLFFSIPVMIIFSLGLRILVNGGPTMVKGGWFYNVLFVFSAFLLLSSTSLAGLREYFKSRNIPIPSQISITWLFGALIIIVFSMTLSAYFPFPSLPKPIYIQEHEYDPWIRNSKFELTPVVATPVEIWEQQKVLEKIGIFCLCLLVSVTLWVIINGLKYIIKSWWASVDAKIIPPFLKRTFSRFFQKNIPVSKKISLKNAKSTKFVNSLSDPLLSKRFTPNQHIEYAYQALCALAEDLGVPKKHYETPLEFLLNLPAPLEVLREEIEELTKLYQAAAYSPIQLDDKNLDRLRKFWLSYTWLRNRVVR